MRDFIKRFIPKSIKINIVYTVQMEDGTLYRRYSDGSTKTFNIIMKELEDATSV